MDLDLKLAERCAEAFSLSTGLGCVITTPGGETLYAYGKCCETCPLCRAAGRDREVCRSSLRYGMHEAERFGGKYIYFCAMGLTCFTSPILGPEHSEAQLVVGPFLMVDCQDYMEYDLALGQHLQPERIEQLRPLIEQIPYVDAERVNGMSELLFLSVGFLHSVSESSRLLGRGESSRYQSSVASYIHELKRTGPDMPYPFALEQKLQRAMGKRDEEQAAAVLNELLGHILFASGGDAMRIRYRLDELLALMSRSAVENGANEQAVFAIVDDYRSKSGEREDVDALCIRLNRALRSFLEMHFRDAAVRHQDTVHRVIGYVQAHYEEPLSLSTVASALSVSQSYLSRLFSEATGMPLSHFISLVRVERGKQLLAGSALSLAEIALQCGFSDQSYFTKVFHRCCGITPLKYRKQQSV